MFANLAKATKGRPLQVWLGAAAAFVLHVAIAVTIGVALFAVLPHRAIEGLVAAMFGAGAVVPLPIPPPNQPHWKTATMTP
jgi:Ca2+/H+ antiporter, TMEM165/GDT1 family